jgi:hypothetical protein
VAKFMAAFPNLVSPDLLATTAARFRMMSEEILKSDLPGVEWII